MSIIFIRHAECEGNLSKKFDPGFYSPLTLNGELQAYKTKTNLAAYLSKIHQIYSSPTTRTISTAKILFSNKLIFSTDKIIECDYGIKKEFIKPANFNWGNYTDAAFPGGESAQDVYFRSLKFYNSLDANKNIAVVTHGVVIASLLHHFENVSLKIFPNYTVNNCGFFILDKGIVIDKQGILNQISYKKDF